MPLTVITYIIVLLLYITLNVKKCITYFYSIKKHKHNLELMITVMTLVFKYPYSLGATMMEMTKKKYPCHFRWVYFCSEQYMYVYFVSFDIIVRYYVIGTKQTNMFPFYSNFSQIVTNMYIFLYKYFMNNSSQI